MQKEKRVSSIHFSLVHHFAINVLLKRSAVLFSMYKPVLLPWLFIHVIFIIGHISTAHVSYLAQATIFHT